MRSLVRAAIASAMSAYDSTVFSTDYVRQRWPSDRDAQAFMQRAAVTPTNLTTGASTSHIVNALLPALTPLSAGADLLSRALRLEFNGGSRHRAPRTERPRRWLCGRG